MGGLGKELSQCVRESEGCFGEDVEGTEGADGGCARRGGGEGWRLRTEDSRSLS